MVCKQQEVSKQYQKEAGALERTYAVVGGGKKEEGQDTRMLVGNLYWVEFHYDYWVQYI